MATPDLKIAKQFLETLAPGEPNTFQIIDDNKARRNSRAQVLHGSLDKLAHQLQRLNEGGNGVFVTVNRTDGEGRKAENITAVRALFIDLDDRPATPAIEAATDAGLPPSIVTQSSHEGFHLYWLVTDCPLDRFTGLQKALSEKFGGDPAVADIPRVMRLPGFVWRKVGKDGKPEGEPFLSCIVTGYDAGARVPTYTIGEVISRLQLSDAIATAQTKVLTDDFAKMVALGSNSPLQPEVRGRWPEILSNLDIDASVLDGQHHPCPGCGGEDRFRFDNLDGNGTFLCSGGGGDMSAGDGFALVRHVFECDRLEADRRVRLALEGGAKVIVADALAEYEQTGTVGVLFGERVLDALNDLHDNDLSEWQTIRARLKADKGVSITEIERGMARQRATEVGPPTADVHDLDYAVETIASFGEGNLLHDGTTFWSWRETGVWSRTDDPSVKKRIHDVVPKSGITGARVNSILDLSRTEATLEGLQMCTKFEGINCLNGELVFRAGRWELGPHDKARHLIAQIPVEYTPGAMAPRFDRFLDEIFAGDDDAKDKRRLVLELIGYSLLSTCRYEKFVILVGNGANGKSVLMDVLRGLCGHENVAAVQPNSLENSFQRASLHGKLVNVVTEIAEGAVFNDAAIKAIVSGEPMSVENKLQNPFVMTPTATCWFGTNHMPHTRDFSGALFRRAEVIPFNNKFVGDDCDPQLKGKLMAELPGILLMALDAIGEVMQTNKFAEPASAAAAKKAWRLEADSVQQFLDERCVVGGDARTPKGDLYRNYQYWSDDAGVRKPLTHKSFTRRLALLDIDEVRTMTARYYHGVRLLTASDDEDEDNWAA